MLGFTVVPQNTRQILRELKQLEPDLFKQMRSEMRTTLKADAGPVVNAVPGVAPLSGFSHSGRTSWGSVSATVVLAPSKLIKGKDMHPLVSLRITSSGRRVGYDIAEIAGSRTAGRNASGVALINNLNQRYPWKGSAGRFAFKTFISLAPKFAKTALDIMNSYITQFNKKVG